MAVRVDASGDSLSRARLAGARTVMAWVYISTDRNAYSALWQGGSNDYLVLDSSGTQLAYYDGATEPTGSNLSTGTWYHIAQTCAGDALGNAWAIYLNGVLDFSGARGAVAAGTNIVFGNDDATEWLNGRLANIKMFDAALTAAEIQQEMLALRPQRFANLWGWWPLWGAADIADYSGNGRTLTAGGTLTTEDGPPVSYGALAIWPPFTASGGTQYTQAASGTLTPAAALIRQTATAKAGSLTPSGAASRQTGKILSGALTPAAALIRQVRTLLSGALPPSGALAAARTVLASMSGSLTPAGALIKRTALSASAVLAAASALTRQAAHILAGALTPSGALASVRTFLQTVSGALTPSGALTRRTGKLLSGALTGAGALTRRAAKAFVGTLAPSGALTTIRAVLLSIGGALTPAGAVARQTAKTLSGALTPAGGLVKQIAQALSGALTSVGALVSSLIGPGTATGRVRATFTSRRPHPTITARRPSATFASRRPNVTFTVEEDA